MQDGLVQQTNPGALGSCILRASFWACLAKRVRCCGAHHIARRRKLSSFYSIFHMKIHLAFRVPIIRKVNVATARIRSREME